MPLVLVKCIDKTDKATSWQYVCIMLVLNQNDLVYQGWHDRLYRVQIVFWDRYYCRARETNVEISRSKHAWACGMTLSACKLEGRWRLPIIPENLSCRVYLCRSKVTDADNNTTHNSQEHYQRCMIHAWCTSGLCVSGVSPLLVFIARSSLALHIDVSQITWWSMLVFGTERW